MQLEKDRTRSARAIADYGGSAAEDFKFVSLDVNLQQVRRLGQPHRIDADSSGRVDATGAAVSTGRQ